VHRISSALGEAPVARVVHQYAPHDLGAQRQEVRPVLTPNSPGVRQLEIRFIGQRGRIQAVTGAPALKVPARDPPQLRIHKICQAIQRVRIRRPSRQ
jgi:hypothetical protein